MNLPQDGHVHTEWSWDAPNGSMEASCARAVELGLPSIAFTEHADFTPWAIPPESVTLLPDRFRARLDADRVLQPPDLDVAGYLDCVQRCRDRFPDLRILSGVELSEPHWHASPARAVLDHGFDRVLGSVHSVQSTAGYLMIEDLFAVRPADEVIRTYLADVLDMVETSTAFTVLAHIDYPVRSWPATAGRFDPAAFEEEFRAVLHALADTGRVLEINSRVPLPGRVVRWWYEIGGDAVCFGSDAHQPDLVADRFAEVAALAEAAGFRPGPDPNGMWTRRAG